MHTTTLKPAGRSTAQMARDVISLFKLRIGVLIMITALVGMAVTPGPAPSFVQALVLAISVLMASASAGAFNQYVEFESDRLMRRTSRRAFATGALPHHPAWLVLMAVLLAVARAARFQDACREDPKGASGRCASTLSGSEKARISMPVKDALDSYIQRDAVLANDVRDRDLEVDQMYNALFREFLTYMLEDPRNITACMHLHFIAKNIERMGDHATGIAEQVIYLATGDLPEDTRPKGESVPRLNTERG